MQISFVRKIRGLSFVTSSLADYVIRQYNVCSRLQILSFLSNLHYTKTLGPRYKYELNFIFLFIRSLYRLKHFYLDAFQM